MLNANRKNVKSRCFDRRKEPRTPYCESIYFATKKRIYEGELKNQSRFGLFIKTPDFFAEGEMIIIAIPSSDHRNDKYKGRIIWSNNEGFGAKLI